MFSEICQHFNTNVIIMLWIEIHNQQFRLFTMTASKEYESISNNLMLVGTHIDREKIKVLIMYSF